MAYEEAALDALEKMATEFDEQHRPSKSGVLMSFLCGLFCSTSSADNSPDEDYYDNSSILEQHTENYFEKLESYDNFDGGWSL